MKEKKIKINSLKYSAIVSIIALLIVMLISRKLSFGISFVIGVISSTIGLLLLVRTANILENLKARMIGSYALRYLIYAIALLVVIVLYSRIHLLISLLGIMIPKIVMIVYCIIKGGDDI